jgi:hypothetical protein
MDPKNVADVFGTRIAKRYVAIQVTIGNRSQEHQFLIHDVSLDVASVLPIKQLLELRKRREDVRLSNLPPELRREAESLRESLTRLETENTKESKQSAEAARARLDEILESPQVKYRLSSEELSVVRGVAEKGQVQDVRNRVFRYLRAAGTIAGGITGVAAFGNSFAAAVAAYNGPLLTSYSETFPDFTINQLIRLNDSAYVANRVVARQQALVFVAFIPQAIFMTRKQAKKFYGDPLSIKDDVDFRQIEVIVDGNFIEEVKEPEPVLTSVEIPEDEMLKFGVESPRVLGQILGQHLEGANVRLKGQPAEGGQRASLDGPASDARLKFVVESDAPVPPETLLVFEVEKDKTTKAISLPVSYQAQKPVLESIDVPALDVPSVDATVTVTLAGKHFMPGDTRVHVTGDGVVEEPKSVTVNPGGTSLTARLQIRAGSKAGIRQVTVSTSAGTSNGQPLELKGAGKK